MSEQPTQTDGPAGDQDSPPPESSRHSRLLLLLGLLVVVAAVIVVLFVVVGRGDDTTSDTTVADGDDSTLVTSPYDLHELPADSGPGEVEDATLVSISRPNATGGTDYFGLSSDTDPAKSIIQAVVEAESVEAAQVAPTEVSITFLLPDRGTLAFDAYVEADIIGRAESYWRVDGDLANLIDTAVSVGQP